MAKSMRSKFKRKNRALLREKYYERDLEKLKKTTARIQLKVPGDEEIVIKKEPDFGNIIPEPASSDREKSAEDLDDSVMEVDELKAKDKTRFRLNPKTLKNEHGNYPVWMNQRKIKQLNKCAKRKTKGNPKGKVRQSTRPKSGISKKKKTTKSKSK